MDAAGTAPDGMTNKRLSAWVDEMALLCRPERVQWVDGSEREYERLCAMMVKSGTFIRLNPDKRPNSFLARFKLLRGLREATKPIAKDANRIAAKSSQAMFACLEHGALGYEASLLTAPPPPDRS